MGCADGNGDRVIIENPTYLGMLMTWRVYGAEFWPIPIDEKGMDVSQLPNTPDAKMIYSIPTYQNPGGVTLVEQRRHHLLGYAHRHGLPLIEDTAYMGLNYDAPPPPTLFELSPVDGTVIYLGTFSKILMPGLRIGWVAASLPVIDALVMAKQSAVLHSRPLPNGCFTRLQAMVF